jgi:hypothetical protein
LMFTGKEHEGYDLEMTVFYILTKMSLIDECMCKLH